MYKLTVLAAISILLAACNNDNSSTTESTVNNDSANTAQTTNDGWITLFDGTNTAAWHTYGGGPAGSAWKIADGALTLDTSTKKKGKVEGGGDLVTNEEFDNFHLKLEWKIAPGGNSGIIFYVNEDTAKYKHSYESGPEMQVVDNDGHSDGKIMKHKAGDLYDLISANPVNVKPAGQWNQVEIKSLNDQLELYQNGEKVVSTTLWDDNWIKMVLASKFKEWPGFGTFKKGRIALQDHDNMVSFRNIVIKKL